MDTTILDRETEDPNAGTVAHQERQLGLSSGRSVVLTTEDDTEAIEVRCPDGQVEVRILLTDEGPVVSLGAARLQLESIQDLSVRCQRLHISAAETAKLESQKGLQIAGEELRVNTTEDIYLNGKFIRLNGPENAKPPGAE